MTINLDGAGGLFPVLRKIEAALTAANTAQKTTVPAAVADALALVESELSGIELGPSGGALNTAASDFRALTGLQRALQTFAGNLIVKRAVDDAQVTPTVDAAITELVRQMNAAAPAETVRENVVSAAVTTAPTGAPGLLITDRRGDGSKIQAIIPEVMAGVYDAGTIRFQSGASIAEKIAPAWPGGSGITRSFSANDTGLLANHSFDNDTARTNTPDDWIVSVGTIGTTVSMTATETQTVTVTGGPSSGTFVLRHTRADGTVQDTTPLPYNVSASDMATALAALVGLESVTVTAAGTLPADVVYTVNFNGATPAGDQALLTATDTFDTGSVGVAEVTAGEAAASYRALALLGNGAELTTIRQALHPLNLAAATNHAFGIQLKAGTAAMGGVMAIEMIDGTGAVLNDGAGNPISTSVTLSGVSNTAFESTRVVLRTPATIPDVYYLQFRLTTAIPNSQALYLDEAVYAVMDELYSGGPWLSFLPNLRGFQTGDRYVVTMANDFAGLQQTLFVKLFDKELPSATSGAETIPN